MEIDGVFISSGTEQVKEAITDLLCYFSPEERREIITKHFCLDCWDFKCNEHPCHVTVPLE